MHARSCPYASRSSIVDARLGSARPEKRRKRGSSGGKRGTRNKDEGYAEDRILIRGPRPPSSSRSTRVEDPRWRCTCHARASNSSRRAVEHIVFFTFSLEVIFKLAGFRLVSLQLNTIIFFQCTKINILG